MHIHQTSNIMFWAGLFGCVFAFLVSIVIITANVHFPQQPPVWEGMEAVISEINFAKEQYFPKCDKTKSSYTNVIRDIWSARNDTWNEWNTLSKQSDIVKTHFDWWMFPWSQKSAGHGTKYTVKYKDCKDLLLSSNNKNKLFVNDFEDAAMKLLDTAKKGADPIFGKSVHPARPNKIYCSFISFIAVKYFLYLKKNTFH